MPSLGHQDCRFLCEEAPLAERARIRALDLRGHGKTNLPLDYERLRNFHIYKNDVIAALEALPHDAHPMGVILAGPNAQPVAVHGGLRVRGAEPERALLPGGGGDSSRRGRERGRLDSSGERARGAGVHPCGLHRGGRPRAEREV